MIDLKNEIEKLKDKFIEYASSLTTGRVDALDKVLDIIEDYNIITAPKTIKLSEIVDNLKLQIAEPENLIKIQFNRKINAIGFGEYDTDWQQNTWQSLVVFYKDLTIKNICIKLQDNIKWLYALWIAGTIIEDDLKEEK